MQGIGAWLPDYDEQRKFRAHGICVQTHGRRCEDVVKKASMKTSWRRLDRPGRRLEGSLEDAPLDYGFNCSQRCEDVFKEVFNEDVLKTSAPVWETTWM